MRQLSISSISAVARPPIGARAHALVGRGERKKGSRTRSTSAPARTTLAHPRKLEFLLLSCQAKADADRTEFSDTITRGSAESAKLWD